MVIARNIKLQKYFDKNISTSHNFEHYCVLPLFGFSAAVVIPVYNENDYIWKTLDSLCHNNSNCLEKTAVVLVINNPDNLADNNINYIANQKLLNLLRNRQYNSISGKLNLLWIDASSQGMGLPKKGGVGRARKLGMDLILKHLNWDIEPIILSLDADTIVSENYLEQVFEYYRHTHNPGAVVSFRHITNENPKLTKLIRDYERYLRHYVAGLKYAKSPYAYYAIGSIITVRASDYVRSGGMKTNEAGEDFYFLQSLRKLGTIGKINKTRVFQSSRISNRVPFGTGPAIQKASDEEHIHLYNNKLFYELKAVLAGSEKWLLSSEYPEDADIFLELLTCSSSEFFILNNFPESWRKIYVNTVKNNSKNITHSSRKKLLECFNIWFDAFRTLKFLHFLERNSPDKFPRIKINY